VFAGPYADAGLVPADPALDGVETVERRAADGRVFRISINHTTRDAVLADGAVVAAGGVLVQRAD
jgi:hypothetical protein